MWAAGVTKGQSGPARPHFRASRGYFGSALATEEAAHRRVDVPALPGRVEPQRVELAAQPGELALGQLAGGGNGAFAQLRGIGRALQVFPGLPVADAPDRG